MRLAARGMVGRGAAGGVLALALLLGGCGPATSTPSVPPSAPVRPSLAMMLTAPVALSPTIPPTVLVAPSPATISPQPTGTPLIARDCGWSGAGAAWLDADGDGLRGAGESPLPGVMIAAIVVGTAWPLAAGPTGADGRVVLDSGLRGCDAPAPALVIFATAPPGYRLTTAAVLPVRAYSMPYQFGFVAVPLALPTARLSETATTGRDCIWRGTGEAWIDENADGVWEANERPLPGVQLTVNDPQFVIPQTTGVDGRTAFRLGLRGCTDPDLIVAASPPPGYHPTTAPALLARPAPIAYQFGFIAVPLGATPTRASAP